MLLLWDKTIELTQTFHQMLFCPRSYFLQNLCVHLCYVVNHAKVIFKLLSLCDDSSPHFPAYKPHTPHNHWFWLFLLILLAGIAYISKISKINLTSSFFGHQSTKILLWVLTFMSWPVQNLYIVFLWILLVKVGHADCLVRQIICLFHRFSSF